MKLLLLLAFVASAYSAYFEPGELPRSCIVYPGIRVREYNMSVRVVDDDSQEKPLVTKWVPPFNNQCNFRVRLLTETMKCAKNGENYIEGIAFSMGERDDPNDELWTWQLRDSTVYKKAGASLNALTLPVEIPVKDGKVIVYKHSRPINTLLIRSDVCQFAINWHYAKEKSFLEIWIDRFRGGMDGLCGGR